MKQRSILSRIASGFLLALIATFAITTMGNVADFVHRYHAGWTGWTLGAAFGVTVFLSSYIAATASTPRTRRIALAISIAFALSSAFFQVDLYLAGGAPLTTAFILAFVPITIGEAGLALLESSYSKDHEAEQEAHLSKKLAVQLASANAQLVAQSEEANQLQLDMQATLQSLQSEIAQSRATIQSLGERNSQLQSRVDQLQAQKLQPSPKPQAQAQPVDVGDISDAQIAILRVIAQNPQVQQKEIAGHVGANASTVSRQLKPLKDGQLVEFDGNSWEIHPGLVAQLNGKLMEI